MKGVTLIIFPSFAITSLLVAAVFMTATTYTQLGVAILLYPLLAFLAYKIFLEARKTPIAAIKTHLQDIPAQTNNIGIADTDKRTFLKLIGATGISFFLISIFGRRIESLIFGQNLGWVPASAGNPSGGKTSPALASPTEGYTISEIDDNIIGYYGFINKEGAWFIMKRDTNSGSFRYAKGGSDFPANWKKRQDLKYDYFHNVFVY